MTRGVLIALLVMMSSRTLSLDRSRPAHQVLPVPETGQRLVLSRGEVWLAGGGRRHSLGLSRYRPWKLTWARVAGQRQLAVGVHKATRFYPEPHNALFLYDWNDGRPSPRWLGSRLSKPFTDFAFADMRDSGETELASIERLRDGRYCLVIYRWSGFGFQGEWQSQPFQHLSGLNARGRVVSAWIIQQGKRRPIRFGWFNNRYQEIPSKETLR